MPSFITLRKKHPQFVYESFSVKRANNNLKITFKFKIEPDINFRPEIKIENINQSKIDQINKNVINNLAFHLGLIEILSYWKAACSPKILIQAGFLSNNQIRWWKDLLLNGMGEFFYANKINFTKPNFVDFEVDSQALNWNRYEKPLPKNKFLVLVGGGKDSVVTLQNLKKEKEIGCLFLNPQRAALKTAAQFRPRQTIIVKRKIDPALLELNRKGYLNGHTPFSAYLAFLSVLSAVLFGFGSVVVSNERSAEEENLIYLKRKINHQYSKTFRFEKLFDEYTRRYLANLFYFSFLRPLWELQIAKLFASFPQFFPIFCSCNQGQKTNSWCNQCPKCLSTFILLYPFLKEEQLKKIFGENLFKQASLFPTLKALIGKSKHKPFECVATYEETLAALFLSLKKERKQNRLPLFLKYFQKEILPEKNNWEEKTKKILTGWNDNHLIPPELAKVLKEKITDEN